MLEIIVWIYVELSVVGVRLLGLGNRDGLHPLSEQHGCVCHEIVSLISVLEIVNRGIGVFDRDNCQIRISTGVCEINAHRNPMNV